MAVLRLALLVLVLALGVIVRANESDVVTLTDDTFDSAIAAEDANTPWLVEFYAPWCGHCKKLVPTWEELATASKGKFKVAKVDCTVEKNTGTRFAVRGFPTIKLIVGGKVYDYRGPRAVADFTAFASGGYSSAEAKDVPAADVKPPAPATDAKPASATGAASGNDVVVLTDTTFQDKISKGIWLIKFYAPWCGHCKKLVPTWDELATSAKGKFNVAKVDCTVEKTVAGQQNIPGYPTVKLFKDGKLVKEYSGPRTLEGFQKFVEAETGKDEL